MSLRQKKADETIQLFLHKGVAGKTQINEYKFLKNFDIAVKNTGKTHQN